MLQGLQDLGAAYWSFMNPLTLLYGLGGALVGIIMGILPGLSATLAIALLTTLTIKLQANDAILVLICSYVGALYGGSRTAILLNIPGTAANAASCADGYALAKQGQAGRAIGIATSGAFVSTLIGVVCLALFTPLLAEVALQFGAFEFFWLALFGVTMSGSIVGGDALKGWVRYFILDQGGNPGTTTGSGAEFGTVDKFGNIFAGEPRPRVLRKYVKIR